MIDRATCGAEVYLTTGGYGYCIKVAVDSTAEEFLRKKPRSCFAEMPKA